MVVMLNHGGLLEDAVVEACYWRCAYDRANPDVGMGSLLRMDVQDMMEKLHVTGLLDLDTVVNRVQKMNEE